jgi:8-oxo-dGTP pyrophosphatase MutT (NUDIX family)
MSLSEFFDQHLVDALRRRLAADVSSAAAPYRRFAPELSYGRHRGPAASDARPAAVVVLLYPNRGRWYLPLTLRPVSMSEHAGQICLPGGGAEPGETACACALRELHEELGVAPGRLNVLGSLPPIYVYASNFLVRPFVAQTPQRPEFHPDRREVAELLEVPLDHLLNPQHHGTQVIVRGRLTFRAPGIAFQGRHIWGATALILGELLERLRGAADEECCGGTSALVSTPATRVIMRP